MENTRGRQRLEGGQRPAPSCTVTDKPWSWAHNPGWLVTAPRPSCPAGHGGVPDGWALSPSISTVPTVVPMRKWSSQRLSWREAAWRAEQSCAVLGLSGGRWLRVSLGRHARNTTSEGARLPPPPSGLDMGYTLPPAFCPQTHLGLNSFGIYSTHGILGVDRDPRIDCWTKEEVGGAEGPDVWARGSLSGCQQLAGSTAEHPQEFPPRMQAVSGEHH